MSRGCNGHGGRESGSDLGGDLDPAHVHVYANSLLVEGA